MSTIPQTMGSLSVISTGFHSGVALTSRERVLHGMTAVTSEAVSVFGPEVEPPAFPPRVRCGAEPEQALMLLAFMRMDA
jgi:hypothetical protein